MLRSTSFGVFLLVFLGVLLTWWATSSLVAQTKSSQMIATKPHGTLTVGPRRDHGKTVPDFHKGPEAKLRDFLQSTDTCQVSLGSFNASADGRQVVVSANFPILERPPHATFLWALCVYDGTTKPKMAKMLSEHYYLNQLFQLPEDQVEMSPTFSETFPLAPGVYRVHVSLYRLPANFDLTSLRTTEPMRFFYGSKRIVVTD